MHKAPKHLHRRILLLALPNILSNITVPLLGTIDLALAGHLPNPNAIGGIALGVTLFNLLYWGFGFLRMGTTGLTAQQHGEGNQQGMGLVLCQSVISAIVIGTALLALQKPLGHLVLQLLHPSPQLTSYTLSYYHIAVWGAPAVMLSYALMGFCVGMQNTFWPMVVSITASVLNIAFSTYFVLVANLGIQGIALGTLIAQYLSCSMLAVGIWFLFFKRHKVQLPEHASAVWKGLGKLFRINSAIFVRTLLLISVTTFFTYAGTQMGVEVLSANTQLLQFFTIFSYFADGFGYAAEALTGHYHGARHGAALRRVVIALLLWGFFIALLVSTLYFTNGEAFLSLLTNQLHILEYARQYMPYIYGLPLIAVAAFIWDGIYVGLAEAKGMVITMFIAVAVFFGTYYGLLATQYGAHLTQQLGLTHPNNVLWIAFLCYLGTRGIAQTLLALRLPSLRSNTPTSVYYLSIGSTFTNQEKQIRKAITSTWPDIELATFYTTPDATGRTNNTYINTVGRLHTTLLPHELEKQAKKLEEAYGRQRNASTTAVALDVDVVMKGVEVLRPKDFMQSYFRQGYQQLLNAPEV